MGELLPPTTTTPAPTTTTTTSSSAPSGAGSCSASSTTPPTTSAFSGYSLTSAVAGPQIPSTSGYYNYGTGGGGIFGANHIKVAGNALEELGYTDPSVGPGVVGAGLQLANDAAPASGGGFTYCYSLSGTTAGWQQAGIVFIAWPQNNAAGGGEIDFMFAGAQSQGAANWSVMETGGCTNCATLAQGTYPTGSPSTGIHSVTVLWKQGVGDSFYIDGKFVTTVPASTAPTPLGNEIPTMQIQDYCSCSSAPASAPLTASLYWLATYASS